MKASLAGRTEAETAERIGKMLALTRWQLANVMHQLGPMERRAIAARADGDRRVLNTMVQSMQILDRRVAYLHALAHRQTAQLATSMSVAAWLTGEHGKALALEIESLAIEAAGTFADAREAALAAGARAARRLTAPPLPAALVAGNASATRLSDLR